MSDIEQRIRDALRDPRRELASWPDPMPRIRRAARRQHARLLTGGTAVTAAAAVTAVGILVGMRGPAPSQPVRHPANPAVSCAAPVVARGAGLGTVVEVSGQSLTEVSLDTGTSRVLVRDAGADIANEAPAFSHDGRWVAFGNASVVSSAGGSVVSVLGRSQIDYWTWSATSDELAAITAQRGVVIGGPGMRQRTVLPAGWGAYDVAFSPCGTELAVSRYPRCAAPATCHVDRGIWLIDLRTGLAHEVFREDKDYALSLAGWSPGGRWLLVRPDFDSSASLAADGLPLEAVAATGASRPIGVVAIELQQPLAWCHDTLIQSAGELRYTFQGKHLVAAAPPDWRISAASLDSRSGWMLPACAGDGDWVAASSAPNTSAYTFAQASQLWLLRPNGTEAHPLIQEGGYQLTPLAWSANSRWILFQRMRVKPALGPAELFLAAVSAAGHLIKTVGPVASSQLSLGVTPLIDGQLVVPYSWYQPSR
jgi:hypothetical protein